MQQPSFAYTQAELLAQLEARLRDTSNARWTDAEIYHAINSAIQRWGDNVLVPMIYSPADWSTQERELDLPSYVRPPLDVYFRLESTQGDTVWQEFKAYRVMPTSGSGLTLQLGFFPPQSDARIIWWARNSTVPTTIPTITTSSITSSSTSVILSAAINVADAGYVKIEQEWLQYAGRDVGASTTTLNNLVRGVLGTTAASHNTAVSVNFGVVVHRVDLYEQLFNQATAFLNGLFLTDAATTEKETHQWNMRYYQQMADEYWRTYTPARSPRFVLSPEVIGSVYDGYPANNPYQYYWWRS